MKKCDFLVFLFIILNTLVVRAQNIAINTTGTAAAATNMFEVTQTSTAANMVAIYAIHSGATTGTGYGLYSTKTGAATTNIGGYFNASGGTNNYAIIVPAGGGSVGIGTSTPAGLLHVTQTATATGALKGIIYTGAVNTNQTLSTEIPSLTLTTAGRQWATGALAAQREIIITQPAYSFVGVSTITDAATIAVEGAPISNTNTTLTNTHAFLIQATSTTDGTGNAPINSYGLTVNAQTGATNNYAGALLGGNVGIGTASPEKFLHVKGDQTLGIALIERSNASTNSVQTALQLRSTSSGSMADGFGPAIIFEIEDNTAAANTVADIQCVRSGADNSGTLSFDTWSGGVQTGYMKMTPTGNVGIGVTPTYKLQVNGQPAANGYTAFTNYSDIRLKKNILDIDSSLSRILQLRPVSFQYNDKYLALYSDEKNLEKIHKGFIAQEVQKIFPEMVGKSPDTEYLDLDISNLQVYLVKAMQEQQKQIETLKAENQKLRSDMHHLKKLVNNSVNPLVHNEVNNN